MNSTKSCVVTALVVLAGMVSIASIGAMRVTANAGASRAQASDDVRRITPDELRALVKQNRAVIVDVRDKGAYNAGHVKGALSIPIGEIEERAKELPRDKMIVAYCS
jgi:predicted sulfurtransferase